VDPNQSSDWRTQFLANATTVFGGGQRKAEPNQKALHALIGELTLENNFPAHAFIKAGRLNTKE